MEKKEISKDEIWQKLINESKESNIQLKKDTELTKKAVDFVLSNDVTSGTNALAMVILHCFNSVEYPFNVTELCLLDKERQKLALGVMRLRMAGKEPHQVLDREEDIEDIKKLYS